MNSLDSHLYSSIRRKKTKRNNRLSPSLSLSLPPFFRARHARETAGGFIRVRGFLPCTTRHGGDSSSRRPKKMPPVSGSQWRRSSARFVGRRARLRGALRSAGDWLSLSGRRDADATFAPPFRLPLPFSTERDPLDTPTPTRMPLLSCSAGIACALYPRLPTNSLSLSLPLSVYFSLCLSLWQRTECTWAESNTRLLTGCHPPFRRMPFDIFLGGSCRRVGGWWNSGWMGALGKMRTGDI